MGAVDKQGMSYCEVCFEKQQKIDTLSETVLRLKATLDSLAAANPESDAYSLLFSPDTSYSPHSTDVLSKVFGFAFNCDSS